MQLNRRIISTLLYHNLKNLLWYCTLYSPILVGKRETYTTHTMRTYTYRGDGGFNRRFTIAIMAVYN